MHTAISGRSSTVAQTFNIPDAVINKSFTTEVTEDHEGKLKSYAVVADSRISRVTTAFVTVNLERTPKGSVMLPEVT